MDNKRKIIDDFRVPSAKYRVIVVESIPNIVFDKVKINGQIYERVPTFSDINYLKSKKSFTNY